jgi:hypothetical protein
MIPTYNRPLGRNARSYTRSFFQKSQTKLFLLFLCVLLSAKFTAQNKLMTLGNKLIDLNNSFTIGITSLPNPGLATTNPLYPYTYHGQQATKHSNVEYGTDGEILFFVVDSKIYNNHGYLIKDILSFMPLAVSESEIHITRIPETCNKYIVMGIMSSDFFVTFIDLGLINTVIPQNTTEFGEAIDLLNSSSDEVWQDYLASIGYLAGADSEGDVADTADPSTYIINLANGGQQQVYSHLEIYDNNVDGDKIVLHCTTNFIHYLKITPTGIEYISHHAKILGQGEGVRSSGGMEVTDYSGFHYSAHADNSSNAVVSAYNNVEIDKYNANWVLLGQVEINTHDAINYPLEQGAVGDLEFSPNGRYLYFNQSSPPYFGYVDLSDNSVHYPSVEMNLGSTYFEPDKYSQIEYNLYQTQPVLFMYDGAHIDIIKNINTPNSLVILQDVFSVPGVLPIESSDASAYYNNQMFVISEQNYKPDQTAALQNADCCEENIHYHSHGNYTHTGTSYINWTYGVNNNPWNATSGPVYINGDITFNSGSAVNISGMDLRFGPESDVFIKANARVRLNNGTLLTSWDCPDLMWQGVDIYGTPNIDQQPFVLVAPSFNAGGQGMLIMNNATIENALVAAQVGTNTSLFMGNTGGLVYATNSTFRNNIRDVYFLKYLGNAAYSGGNYSQFTNCDFLTNENTKFLYAQTSITHAEMKSASGLVYTNCSFRNIRPYTGDMQWRGRGLVSSNSTFSCTGANDNYLGTFDTSHDTFYKLRQGISVTGTSTFTFTLNRMWFQECNVGLLTTGVSNEIITSNTFHIPDFAALSYELPKGAAFSGSTAFTFKENTFQSNNLNNSVAAQNVGALFNNVGGAVNFSFKNNFTNLWKGQESQGSNWNSGSDGLELRCNTYTNCKYDQYLSSYSKWRVTQGSSNANGQKANNKFSFNLNNCLSDDLKHDMKVSDYNTVGYSFKYFSPNNQSYIPDCTSPFMDIITLETQFNADCSTGPNVLPGSSIHSMHQMAKTNYDYAVTQYNSIVDLGEKADIIATINAAFPLASSQLKSYLLNHSPLSDSVMVELASHFGIMDSWHLTEVLLANSPLTSDVMRALEDSDILSDFFMNILWDSYYGGATNWRQLLEWQMADRATELADWRGIVVAELMANEDDEFDLATATKALAEIDGDPSSILWLLDYYIATDNETQISNYMSVVAAWPNSADLVTLKQMQIALQNNWEMADAPQLAQLQYWVDNKTEGVYGYALAILHSLSLIESMPEPEVPMDERSWGVAQQREKTPKESLLSAYPSPANSVAHITYPFELDGHAILFLHDPIGREIKQFKLSHNGVFELDCQNLAEGVYILSLYMNEYNISTLNLTIMH